MSGNGNGGRWAPRRDSKTPPQHDPFKKQKTCGRCVGSGVVQNRTANGHWHEKNCPVCKGSGKV